MASGSPPSIWPELLPELEDHIIGFLSHNDAACGLRLVSKVAARRLRGPQHTTVRLSQPVPTHAFAQHWGAPGITRGLSLRQRQQLLCLTAASGSVPNMEVALEAAGCAPPVEAFAAAAVAGIAYEKISSWSSEWGYNEAAAAVAAAQAGHRGMAEWFLASCSDLPFIMHDAACRIAVAAARGGHVSLMEWAVQGHAPALMQQLRYYVDQLMVAVAEGCDLATLQRLHRQWLEWQQEAGQPGDGVQRESEGVLIDVMAAAAGSPTADWQAKVAWLEEQGVPLHYTACVKAARQPDALDRIVWLRQRRFPLFVLAAVAAAAAGNLSALQYLHGEGLRLIRVAQVAAKAGHMDVLAWLVEIPARLKADISNKAAAAGCDLVVTWLSESPETHPDATWFSAAAQSGSLELMIWLRERGCPWDENAFAAAAAGGNEEALEWLLQQGCPMPPNGMPYKEAALNDDLATLRCLRRLGCPWGPAGAVLSGEVLTANDRIRRWLLAAGCPVDWQLAEAELNDADMGDMASELIGRLKGWQLGA